MATYCIVRRFAVALSFMLASVMGVARSADFRVENRVYVADVKEPLCRSTTIFHGNMVYDCLASPTETVVFDKAAARFVLLSLTRQVRCELSTAQVAAFTEQLQSRTAKSKDPFMRFFATPKFDEHSDNGDELTLTSPWLTYRVTMSREPDAEIVAQYRDSCDAYAQLNALLGSQPPKARLMLDAALAERQATALRIVRTVTSGKGAKQKTVIRSEHELVRPLDESDLQRVAQTREAMGAFKLVSFERYRQAEPR